MIFDEHFDSQTGVIMLLLKPNSLPYLSAGRLLSFLADTKSNLYSVHFVSKTYCLMPFFHTRLLVAGKASSIFTFVVVIA